MSREKLISANDLLTAIRDDLHINGSAFAMVKRHIENAPAVDAVEVVCGRWIYHECVSSHEGTISGYSCSECHSFVNEEMFDMDEFHKDFCGHCGAKMDGGNEDD